ncbi:Uncharacterised protein [uncultured archaeon]|nr:Uncharacterised protein [uncultured archaeon]
MEINLEEKLKETELLIKNLDRIGKFSNKYSITPTKEALKLAESMQNLAKSIPEVQPKNEEEVVQSELKRRLHGEGAYLEHQASGRLYDFDTVINILGIPKEDITSLRPWLETTKEKTTDAIERLFHSRDIEGYELAVPSDIPGVRRQAEEFAGAHIQRYHKTIGKFLQGLTSIGGFLREISAVPTTQDRSYFHPLTNNLAISIPRICFSKEDGTLHIRDKELIELYGHEGMGHALNYVITRLSKFPYILKHNSDLNSSTRESVAQFYENRLLEDLKNSPETQKALGIEHKFDGIYQEAKDTEQLEEYKRNITYYTICVLADKSMGEYNDPEVQKKKFDLVSEVAIDKARILGWMQQQRYNFDSEGNLGSGLVSELRYCANPVARAIEEFSKRGVRYDNSGRTVIDSTLLTGFWTPLGFVDNARIQAQSYAPQR